MAELTWQDKIRLEKLFGMKSGYVLDFTNTSFAEFIFDSVGRNVYSGTYDRGSNSKANLLRGFWEAEPNHVVAQVIEDLVQHSREVGQHSTDTQLVSQCLGVASRLRQSAPVEDIEVISERSIDTELDQLARSVRAFIDNNEPTSGLDRLHTLATRILRDLCRRRGISTPKNKPLHNLMGEFARTLKAEGRIRTRMTERILKSSIRNLDAFNAVRNDHSFAHDNPELEYEESLLILSHVLSSIRFLQALERPRLQSRSDAETPVDDLPF